VKVTVNSLSITSLRQESLATAGSGFNLGVTAIGRIAYTYQWIRWVADSHATGSQYVVATSV